MVHKDVFYILVPSEPLNLYAHAAQPFNTTVRISWSPPRYHNGFITKYHAYYKKTKTIIVVRDTTKETSYVVTDLTPYTNYSFWVRAETSAGVGNKCLQRAIMTHEGGNSVLKNRSTKSVLVDIEQNIVILQ